MSITPEQVIAAAARWGMGDAASPVAGALATYGNLLMMWNARLNLTSIRNEGQLIERHLLEGLFAGKHHPMATTALDFGSGTGIPGIPIAIANPQIRVTLAESQRKKAAFLREVLRSLCLNAAVHAGRAEALPPGSFSTVWMRAVDRSDAMLPLAASLVAPAGRLCLLTSRAGAASAAQALGSAWGWETVEIPQSDARVLHIGAKL